MALSAGGARSLNERIRDLVEDAADRAEWLFFCECGVTGCCGVIWLSATAFDDRVAGGGRLLADGHESRAARARAALRRTVSVRAELAESELLDALEDVERLLDHAEDEDICPATRTLLLALDDALQESAVQPAESPHGLQSLPVGP